MAHELDFTTDGQARMFYVQSEGQPWHGLGNAVPAPLTAEDAIIAAGMDWTVNLKPVSNEFGVIADHFSVVRDDTRETFTVVKSRYTPVQNRQVFSFADQLGVSGMKYHTAGAIRGGRKVWVLGKLPGSIKVIGKDIVEKYVLFSTAHDGSQQIRAMLTPVRVVCSNTLHLAMLDGEYLFQSKHTSEVHNKIKKAKDLFVDLAKKEAEFTTGCQRMALTNVNDEQIEAFLYSVLGYNVSDLSKEIPTRTKNSVAAMQDLAQSGLGTDLDGVRGTLWGVYNAVTEYVDHHTTRREGTDHNDAIWFGSGATLKEKAWTKALELAV